MASLWRSTPIVLSLSLMLVVIQRASTCSWGTIDIQDGQPTIVGTNDAPLLVSDTGPKGFSNQLVRRVVKQTVLLGVVRVVGVLFFVYERVRDRYSEPSDPPVTKIPTTISPPPTGVDSPSIVTPTAVMATPTTTKRLFHTLFGSRSRSNSIPNSNTSSIMPREYVSIGHFAG